MRRFLCKQGDPPGYVYNFNPVLAKKQGFWECDARGVILSPQAQQENKLGPASMPTPVESVGLRLPPKPITTEDALAALMKADALKDSPVLAALVEALQGKPKTAGPEPKEITTQEEPASDPETSEDADKEIEKGKGKTKQDYVDEAHKVFGEKASHITMSMNKLDIIEALDKLHAAAELEALSDYAGSAGNNN